jgi:maleylacetate reductase
VVYGKPAGPALRAEAERLGARRVFVTTTKSVAQSALLADVIRDLGERYAGVYAGITAHSPRPCVIEGAHWRASQGRPDRGGGRRLGDRRHQGHADRAVAERDPIEDLDLYRAGRPKEGAAPPSEAIKPPADAIRMIAVPTTLSAAEFNAFAGISDPRHGIKESFGHRLIVPRVIVLDPAATLATPMDLMLSTGLKAVDHAVERLCSQQANPFAVGTSTRGAEAARAGAAGAQGQARRHGDAARPAVRHVAVDRRRHLGRGRRRSHGIGHVLGAACQCRTATPRA